MEERAVPERGEDSSGKGVSEMIGGFLRDDGVPGLLLLRFVCEELEVRRGLWEEVVRMCGRMCLRCWELDVFLEVGSGA